MRVVNQTGSSNTPTDSTYLNICISPRFSTNSFIQPVVVTVKITYIIQFQEPTILQEVPLPINVENILKKQKKKVKAKNKQTLYNQGRLAGIALATGRLMMGPNRYRALRYR